jgi:hypothetical protein
MVFTQKMRVPLGQMNYIQHHAPLQPGRLVPGVWDGLICELLGRPLAQKNKYFPWYPYFQSNQPWSITDQPYSLAVCFFTLDGIGDPVRLRLLVIYESRGINGAKSYAIPLTPLFPVKSFVVDHRSTLQLGAFILNCSRDGSSRAIAIFDSVRK